VLEQPPANSLDSKEIRINICTGSKGRGGKSLGGRRKKFLERKTPIDTKTRRERGSSD